MHASCAPAVRRRHGASDGLGGRRASSFLGSNPSARSTTLSAIASITPCPSVSNRSNACRTSARCCSVSSSFARPPLRGCGDTRGAWVSVSATNARRVRPGRRGGSSPCYAWRRAPPRLRLGELFRVPASVEVSPSYISTFLIASSERNRRAIGACSLRSSARPPPRRLQTPPRTPRDAYVRPSGLPSRVWASIRRRLASESCLSSPRGLTPTTSPRGLREVSAGSVRAPDAHSRRAGIGGAGDRRCFSASRAVLAALGELQPCAPNSPTGDASRGIRGSTSGAISALTRSSASRMSLRRTCRV